MALLPTYRDLDGITRELCYKQNRNTTTESLEAVFNLLLSDNENDFIKYYCLATHDSLRSGKTTWNMINNIEHNQAKMREYYKNNREKFKKYQEEEKKAKALIEKLNNGGFDFENV